MKRTKIVDLTHAIDPSVPTWSGDCGFSQSVVLDYGDCTTSTKFRVQQFSSVNGIGTHMDAPAHCIEGAATIDELPVEALCVPSVVIDVHQKVHAQYMVNVDDICAFELAHGMIPAGALVIFYTGWDKYWYNARAYRNELQFPSVSVEVAQLLVERHIVGIAIDTLGVDRPESGFPVHKLLLQAGIYIIENVTRLCDVPPVGAQVFALPMKIQGATEAPTRLIAVVSINDDE